MKLKSKTKKNNNIRSKTNNNTLRSKTNNNNILRSKTNNNNILRSKTNNNTKKNSQITKYIKGNNSHIKNAQIIEFFLSTIRQINELKDSDKTNKVKKFKKILKQFFKSENLTNHRNKSPDAMYNECITKFYEYFMYYFNQNKRMLNTIESTQESQVFNACNKNLDLTNKNSHYELNNTLKKFANACHNFMESIPKKINFKGNVNNINLRYFCFNLVNVLGGQEPKNKDDYMKQLKSQTQYNTSTNTQTLKLSHKLENNSFTGGNKTLKKK